MTADHPSASDGELPAGAAESILLDEPSTTDLRAKVTEAWREFARALAVRLRDLPVGAHLDVTLDPTASGTGDAVYSISVDVDGDGALSARAVGNATLPAGYRLDRGAVADMIALGWSPPGVVAGSGGAFGLDATTAESTRVAALLSRTLRDVYGAPHPAFLVYLVHDAEGSPWQWTRWAPRAASSARMPMSRPTWRRRWPRPQPRSPSGKTCSTWRIGSVPWFPRC